MTSREPVRLRRSANRVLGGVCAGLAEQFGIDPLLVRIATVVIGLFSGGLVLLAYVVAWVLMPAPAAPSPGGDVTGDVSGAAGAADPAAPTQALPGPAEPAAPAGPGAKQAWGAVGDELRTLVDGLRTPANPAVPERERSRSPLEAADRAATEAGERLRTPEVRESAGRLAEGLSTAVTRSVDEIGRKVKRSS